MSQAMNISKDDKGHYLWTPDPSRRFNTAAEAEQHGERLAALRTKRAGGRLSPLELKSGVHELSYGQSATLANYVPVKPPADKPLTETERAIKTARKAVQDEKYASMTPAEQTLHNALKRQSEEIELSERKAEHENNPYTIGTLVALDQLIEEIKFDRSRTSAELFEALKARKQAESYEGDLVATNKMVRNVFANEEIRRERLLADASNRRQALEDELAALTRRTPNPVPVTGDTLAERAASLEAGITADPSHQYDSVSRLIEAKHLLAKGDESKMVALLAEFTAAPATTEATTNE